MRVGDKHLCMHVLSDTEDLPTLARQDSLRMATLGREANKQDSTISETKMELFGGDSKGLYMLNSELKTRVYTAPSLVL